MEIRYRYIMEYVPVRFNATSEQNASRQTVYRFKDGIINNDLKSQFSHNVEEMVSWNKTDWVVLFIPASNENRTMNRFGELADYIESHTGVKATISGIVALQETESQCCTGRRYDKTGTYRFDSSYFAGKNVILIDDVFTTGLSLRTCAAKLIQNGAKSVQGLFLAKTVHPHWDVA